MTQRRPSRSWALHLENTQLRQQLTDAIRRIRRLEQRHPHCAYCGDSCPRGQTVCRAHADLLRIDKDAA